MASFPLLWHIPLLSLLTGLPLLALLIVLSSKNTAAALRTATVGAALELALSIYLLLVFDPHNTGIQLTERWSFADMSYCVGVDGLNLLFIPLTAVLTLLAMLYTAIIRPLPDKSLIACLMGYEAVLMGAFTALNLMQFWLWLVAELIPVVVLTLHRGTGQMRRSVTALFLQYWGSSLLMVLAGFLFLAFGLVGTDRALSFDWLTIKTNNDYLHDEVLVFILLFFGFSIRMPLFPFHGWLPLLAEQGSVASGLVFIVGLKLGVYAVIRFILPILPGVAEDWALFVVVLSLTSILYGTLLALMQINIRRLLAFSAINHTGMMMIGAFSFNDSGLAGSLLLAMAYGLATAGMLLAVGLVYSRTGTAFIPRLGGLFDNHSSVALLFIIAALSTLAIPGTPGFNAAHLLIEGIIGEYGWLLAITLLLGNVLAAASLFKAFQQMFIAPRQRRCLPADTDRPPVFKERIIAVLVSAILIGTGFYSTPWLNFIGQDVTAIQQGYPVHSSKEPLAPKDPPDSNPEQREQP